MTRAEHLAWAKTRALEFVAKGEVLDAFNPLCCDLGKHPELEGHCGIPIGIMMFCRGTPTQDEMRSLIEGFR